MALTELDTQQLLMDPPRSPDRRMRLEHLLAVVMVGWLVFGLGYAVAGRITAVVDFVIAGFTGILWAWLRWGKDTNEYWIGHLNLLISLSGLCAVSLLTGAGDAMALWYVVAMPLLATYQHGVREGAVWAAICIVALIFVHASPLFLPIETRFVADGWAIWFGQSFLIAVVVGFGMVSNALTQEYVEKIWWREAAVREKALEVSSHATQLASDRDSALVALEARSQFLANMSHEIRTPLNGVLGMTRVLMETNLSSEQLLMVRTIDKSGKSLLGIINDVLDFSKLEAGQVELESLPFDLRECVEDVLDLFSGPAFEKNIELAYRVDPMVSKRVEGDVARLRQILLNLISNGIKFTEAGSVVVLISAGEGEKIVFEVRDTGIGISEENSERLFESFTQVDSSPTRKQGGSGLGLGISRRLAEMMGGEMWLESEPDEGSSFFFSAELPTTDTPIRTGELADPMGLHAARCLILASDRPSRRSFVEMAELWGMELLIAESEDELAERLDESGNPDFAAVFDGDWSEASIATIREQRPGMPIIHVAPLADPRAGTLTERHDFAALVPRPIRYRQSRQVFEAVLSGTAPDAPRTLSPFDQDLAMRIPLRVLVAEDNPVNQRVIVAMLERFGYEPDVAENGNEVIVKMRRRDYDLIFMDLHMPGMDGLETTRRIRKGGRADHPWIIAMTANVFEEERRRCLAVGMNAFLGKPFEVENLVRAIEDVGKDRGIMHTDESILGGSDSFDRRKLDELRQLFPGRPEKYRELVHNHLDTGDELLERIEASIESVNSKALEVSAHSFKSSAAMFGSLEVSDVAKKIEDAAIADDIDRAARLFKLLSNSWASSRKRLLKEIG